MAKVVRERDSFDEVFIELERAGDVPRNRGDFNRVREPRAQMIADAVQKNLRLVFETPKGARVNHAVTITLVLRAPFGRNFLVFATACFSAELGVRREISALDFFEFDSCARHRRTIGERAVWSQRGALV